MAALKDFIAKPKFFKRKPGFERTNFLCEKCQEHQIVIGAKWSCDYYLFTDVLVKDRHGGAERINLHMWCEVDPAPKCLRAFEEVGIVNA